MRIAVLGLGYVGTTVLACLLRDGHEVLAVDRDPSTLRAVREGRSPVAEPGLEAHLGRAQERLRTAPKLEAPHLTGLEMAIVCVGTPLKTDAASGCDLAPLMSVSEDLGGALREERAGRTAPLLIVVRSTVAPGTIEDLVIPALERASGFVAGDDAPFELAYNPEFLRETTALNDYSHPARIVLGERRPGITNRLRGLYDGLDAPLFEVPYRLAELVKLADNGFHALKVAFANELGRTALAYGIDPQSLAEIFTSDTKLNLSSAYLRPGGPFGGSCLGKDLQVLLRSAARAGLKLPVLDGVLASNARHAAWIEELIRERVRPPARILLVGLSFKAGGSDLRNSPALALAERLLTCGYRLKVADPDLCWSSGVRADHAAAAEVMACLIEDERSGEALEAAAAEADLVVLAKPAAVPATAPVLDISRLRLPSGPPQTA